MNMFTHERARDCISLAVSGGLIPWFVSVCLVFFFTHVRLFSVFVQGCYCLPVTFLLSLPDILCFFIVLRSTFASLSVPCFFPLCDISLPCGGCHAFGCQFSQTVAYATVCICNLITDAPHWQQVQLCMDLCLSLISQEILSCVVQNMWMRVCVHVCGCVKEIVFADLTLVWILLLCVCLKWWEKCTLQTCKMTWWMS